METLTEFMLTKENNELKLELIELKQERVKLKASYKSMVVSRNIHKKKSINVLRVVIQLRKDGLLDLTSKQISERYFTTNEHVRNLSSLMSKGK